MSDCRRLHPVLSRVADGECTPAEALHAAAHLRECTACRIVLARERRLARALEGELEDPIRPDLDFAREVMARLPAGRPPRRGRRGLKLAMALAAAALAGSWAARAFAWVAGGGHRALLPGLEPGATEGLPELAAAAARTLVALLQAAGTRWAPAARLLPDVPALGPALAASVFVAVVLLATVTAVLAGPWLRPRSWR